MAIAAGTRFPAYATSMGRVLLADKPADWLDDYLARTSLHGFTGHTITSPAELRQELRKIKTHGWALIDQELEEGVRSIAATIRDTTGRDIATVRSHGMANAPQVDVVSRSTDHHDLGGVGDAAQP